MGSTLEDLRTGALNLDLGLSSDSDNRFGDTTARDYFLRTAYQRLWPQMGRLIVEEVVKTTGVQSYELDAIRDINRVDIVSASTGLVTGRVPSWSLVADESSDPPTLALLVTNAVTTGDTMRVIGYAPYTVPATASDTSELPESLEFIIVVGARAEAYRRRLNQFVDYEQHATSNPTTAISASELRDLYLAAKSEFEQLRYDHRRDMAAPKRGRFKV